MFQLMDPADELANPCERACLPQREPRPSQGYGCWALGVATAAQPCPICGMFCHVVVEFKFHKPRIMLASFWIFLGVTSTASGLSVPVRSRLSGIKLRSVKEPNSLVDLNDATSSSALLVLGTYPADFNQIEYAQKLRHYLPKLFDNGVKRAIMVVNGPSEACSKLASMLDLPAALEILSDPTGLGLPTAKSCSKAHLRHDLRRRGRTEFWRLQRLAARQRNR